MPKPPHSHRGGFSRRARHRFALSEPDAGSDVTWGVGAVSSRLSITASTLRTWERRYGVGPSFRTEGRAPPLHRARHRPGRADAPARRRGVSRRRTRPAWLDRSIVTPSTSRSATELNRKPAQLAAEDLGDAVLAAVVTGDHSRAEPAVRRPPAAGSGDRGLAGRPGADLAPDVVGERGRCGCRRCGIRGIGADRARAARPGGLRTARRTPATRTSCSLAACRRSRPSLSWSSRRPSSRPA